MSKKIVVSIVVILLVATAVMSVRHTPTIGRASMVGTLFTGTEQYDNFNRIQDLYPTTTLTVSAAPIPFPVGEPVDLPGNYFFLHEERSVADFLDLTDTVALLIVVDGEIRFEKYFLSGGQNVNWLSMSVAKSYIATLIGMAIEDGFIDSINEPITKYVPELSTSAYNDVRIKDILQMSSGAAWNEDYGDLESDVMRMGAIMAIGGSLDKFTAGLVNERAPGKFNQYNSADTQALGMLLSRATGESITSYMQRKLWQPLGAESEAYWMTDDHNVEMAFGGLNATARDYAKLGELYRNQGNWHGKSLISAGWIRDATTPDAPHLRPGEIPDSDYVLGYGYQWWLMDGEEGEYSAIGVYNQFIYVNPTRQLVIVKLSAYSDYASSDDETGYRELESIALFRAIGGLFALKENST